MTESRARQDADVDIELIGEYVNDAYTLHIEAHNNALECRVSITAHDADNSIAPAELITLLRNHDITTTVDLEQVAIFCTEAAQGEDPQQFVIAKGREPIHGKDGWFELTVATGKEKTALIEDESGKVDFKSIQTFSNVEPGQQVGTIHPPTNGEPGSTITNAVIPPKVGNPIRVNAGVGIQFSEDGTKAIATQAGRAIFDNNTLAIVEEFVVNGNVDLSVGHISFNGLVDIKGDVLDDFNITATKGINVTGSIGDCQIRSDGPVTIGSMAGRGTGKITCNGTLQARYLNQVNVECRGNVNISHEVRNSVIKATGSINVPKGLVTGGEMVALEGVEVKILGTRTGTKTAVTSGVYFPETDRLQYLRSRLKSLSEQTTRIGGTINTLLKQSTTSLRKALREAIELRIDILTQRSAKLGEEQKELEEELLQFSAEEHPTANPKINILGALKEGVSITLGETTNETTTEISGPLSIIENLQLGGLRYLSYSPLKINADQFKEEAQQEDQVDKA